MPSPRATASLLLAAIALTATTGCGSKGGDELATSDAANVLEAQRTIDAACGSDGTGTPGGSAAGIPAAVTTLANLAKQYPDDVYETGNVDKAEKLSTVAHEVSTQLKRCQMADQAARL